MTGTLAVLIGIALGLAANALVVIAHQLVLRSKRRRIIARTLAAFDAEFGSALREFS